jgi:superfamily II DNA or RNA helicase
VFTLRHNQQLASNEAVRFVNEYKPGEHNKLLFASPTGTGKSFVELDIKRRLENAWLITPSLEIISDLVLKETGTRYVKPSLLMPHAWDLRISTPVRFKNKLLAGEVNPSALIVDEVHHFLADTYKDVELMCGTIPIVGCTATPYRGTAKGTMEFIKMWSDPIWIYTLKQAIEGGFWKMPHCETIPLINDDEITITNGEFEVSTIRRETESKIRDIGNLIMDKGLDIATVVRMPTRENVYALSDYLTSKNYPNYVITDKTPTKDRHEHFRNCEDRKGVLLQIKAVSEGNDLKVRRAIDCSPCISPVFFMQFLGRITRPTEEHTEYLCTNRNLLRHAYLFEGHLPVQEYQQSESAFNSPMKSQFLRSWDIESLGRLKPSKIKFTNGLQGECYALEMRENGRTLEYTAIVHPYLPETIWAKRENSGGIYGKFILTNPPESVKGFQSKSGNVLTPKQEEWFQKKALVFGLDPEAKLDKRVFHAFVCLHDLRLRIKPG